MSKGKEKVSFESYEEYAAMIDRVILQLTGKTHKRTPEEEEKLRKAYEKLLEKIAKNKKGEGIGGCRFESDSHFFIYGAERRNSPTQVKP